MYEWPVPMPEGCPPADAVPARGTVFRLVSTSTPTEKDFRSHTQRWPDRTYEKPCLAAGISVLTNPDEIETFKALVPGMRKKQVSRGIIDGAGLMKFTPSTVSSHLTWWRPINDSSWTTFKVLAGATS